MAWAKGSDNSALHPLITGVYRRVREADERSLCEIRGFIWGVALQSAALMEDYWFDVPIAQMISPERWEVLVDQSRRAGLITHVKGRGMGRRFRIVEDPDFIHIRYRDDVEWDRQRDKDRRDPGLIMPVLRRDGDVCRFCGLVVNWSDRRSGRGGTFDHLRPGEPASLETYVVACRTCNSRRKASPTADVDVPLRPAPLRPYFSPSSKTVERLREFYGPDFHPTSARPEDTATSARPEDTATSARPEDTATSARPEDTATSARPEDTATSARPEDTATKPGRSHIKSRSPAISPDPEGGCRDGTGLGSGLGPGSGQGPGPGSGGDGSGRGARGRRGGR